MIEIFLVTIAAFSTLAFLTFLCVQNKKYDVQEPMQKSKSFQKEMMKNEPKVVSRNGKNNQQKNDQDQKLSDIEKGLLNSNSRSSYSTQKSENDQDNNLSRTNSNQIETPTTQASVVFANPLTAMKLSHREMALPPPPHLRQIDSTLDNFLQRSESDINKKNSAPLNAVTNLKAQEHPLEKSTSKRSLIPLPSTPVDIIRVKTFPPPPVLKRGKSQSELDLGSGNIDLGYENLTLERNNLNKRYSTDVIAENCVPGSYPRPRHYAQLKMNSYHGSFSDMTPPNSAQVQRSFDFSPKNTRIRGRTITSGPESSPYHPPIPNNSGISPNSTRSFKIDPLKANQLSLEIKLSDITNQMNKRSLDDSNSLSPVDESSPRIRNDSTDTSEIHENSIYNLNELSSPEIQTESSGSGRSKKRYQNESSSSDDYSTHENILYESIDGDLNDPSLREDNNKKHKVMLEESSYSQHNSCVFYSELERTDPTYYDSITMMRMESNASTKDSNYGNFLKTTTSNSLEGCEHYDTLAHFPSVSSSKPNPNRSSPEEEVFVAKGSSPMSTPPHDTQPQNPYESLSEDEDKLFIPSLSQLRKSVHDYEKINEADLKNLKREIGPF